MKKLLVIMICLFVIFPIYSQADIVFSSNIGSGIMNFNSNILTPQTYNTPFISNFYMDFIIESSILKKENLHITLGAGFSIINHTLSLSINEKSVLTYYSLPILFKVSFSNIFVYYSFAVGHCFFNSYYVYEIKQNSPYKLLKENLFNTVAIGYKFNDVLNTSIISLDSIQLRIDLSYDRIYDDIDKSSFYSIMILIGFKYDIFSNNF